MGSLVVITTNEDPNSAFPEHAEDRGTSMSALDLHFGADPSQGLIPGLPDELALRCLAFVPYVSRMSLSVVCKAWRNCFRSTTVYNLRHQAGALEEILCLSFLERPSSSDSACLSLKLLDKERWRWLPLASEYRHTKCKVKSFQCRAFHHKVYVFSNADWVQLKEANWPNLDAMHAHGGPLDVPDVVACSGRFFTLEGPTIRKFSPTSNTWEDVVRVPKRHSRSGNFKQKYFLVSLAGQVCLIDVWQERLFWRPRRLKANMSFLSVPLSAPGDSQLEAEWGPVHRPVGTCGKDLAGFAVFYV